MEPVIQIGQQTIDAKTAVELMVSYQLLPQLAREVIIDQALAGVDCSPAEEQQAREEFFQQQRLVSDVERQAWMKQRQLTLEQVTATALRPFKLNKYKEQTWGHKLESYFLKRKGTLDRVIYSLLRVKDAGLAQELYFRLVDDQRSFSDLAAEYSQGPEAKTGGLLGPVDLATPHPTLARMLSVSKPGQLWPPTPVESWFVILRLEKFLPAQLDDAMRPRLLEELFNTWMQDQLKTVSVTMTPIAEAALPAAPAAAEPVPGTSLPPEATESGTESIPASSASASDPTADLW